MSGVGATVVVLALAFYGMALLPGRVFLVPLALVAASAITFSRWERSALAGMAVWAAIVSLQLVVSRDQKWIALFGVAYVLTPCAVGVLAAGFRQRFRVPLRQAAQRCDREGA